MIQKFILLLPLLVGTNLAAPAPAPVPQGDLASQLATQSLGSNKPVVGGNLDLRLDGKARLQSLDSNLGLGAKVLDQGGHKLGLASAVGQRVDNFNGNRVGTTSLGVAGAYDYKNGPHSASVTGNYGQTRSTHFDTIHNAGVAAGYGYTRGAHTLGVGGNYGRSWGGFGGARDNWGANVGYTYRFGKK